MLRRAGQSSPEPPAPMPEDAGWPALDDPFGLEDRPPGVRFYQGRESCFHPYGLLQFMRLSGEELTLSYVTAEIIIQGRGLHGLYVHLAGYRVARIVEQG